MTDSVLRSFLKRVNRIRNPWEPIGSLRIKVGSLITALDITSPDDRLEITSLESLLESAARDALDVINCYLHKRKGSISILDLVICNRYSYSNLEHKYEDLQILFKFEEIVDSVSKRLERLTPRYRNRSIVGFDEKFWQIKTFLAGSTDLRFLSIYGMGGAGKTTLVKEIYEDSYVKYRFMTRAWVTVSRTGSATDIIRCLVDSIGSRSKGKNIEKSKKILQKSLNDKRYLIVLDDVWNMEDLDSLREVLPKGNNSSRIILTTQLSLMDLKLYPFVQCLPMRPLTFGESRTLLCRKAFDADDYPLNLESIVLEIVRYSSGVPLVVVVFGGLLFKVSKIKFETWENIASFLGSKVLEDEEPLMKVLYLSYSYLPYHLKACFLCTRFFPEAEISVPQLIRRWIDKGLLRKYYNPENLKVQELARDCLKDLVDRNLIMVLKRNRGGEVETCSIHTLCREFCIKQAKNNQDEENFSVSSNEKAVADFESNYPGEDDDNFSFSNAEAVADSSNSKLDVVENNVSPCNMTIEVVADPPNSYFGQVEDHFNFSNLRKEAHADPSSSNLDQDENNFSLGNITKEDFADPSNSDGEGISMLNEEQQKDDTSQEEDLDMSLDMLLHDNYTRDCILYCSVLPTGYEFSKDILVWLWIAQGGTRVENEDSFEKMSVMCFDTLLKLKYIVPTGYDYFNDQVAYKFGTEMNAFLQKQPVEYQFAKELASEQSEVKPDHMSLAFKNIGQINFGIIKKLSNLKTLMIYGCYGSQTKHLPFDLFLELKALQVLNLSRSEVVELPSSIENSKAMRYLDMSETSSRWLPESISCLTNLQTLKLDGCLSLTGLPKRMNELINLKHLIIDVARQLESMPAGIGKLSKLCTLGTFLVGEKDGCRIDELQNMNKLNGSLRFLNLENVLNPYEAQCASLHSKDHLKNIEFIWSDLQDAENEDEEKILECLRPPIGIQELKIFYYSGGNLPYWISDPSFSEMVGITLYKCKYCQSLPSLGQLPSLKFLSIVGMDEVLDINPSFCGKQRNQHQPLFLKLEKLSLNSMAQLKSWTGIEIGDFPVLIHLIIEYCPEFVHLSSLSYLTSLVRMEISYCPELENFHFFGRPPKLEYLMIKDCPKLKDHYNIQGLYWSEVSHVPAFYIDNEKVCVNT